MLSPAVVTYIAAEVIRAGARVKFVTGRPGRVQLAHATDVEIGTALLHSGRDSYPAEEGVGVALINCPGTVQCLAGGAITAGAVVKRAADGKVTVDGVGDNFGIALEAAASGDWLEVLRVPGLLTTVADGNVTPAKLADAIADKIADFTIAITNAGSPNGNATVTLQAKDAQGNNLATHVVFEVWFAGTAWAAPADLGTLTAGTGTILKVDTTDALARVVSDATGLAVLTLDTATDGAVTAHAEVNGLAKSATANITGN